LGNEGGYSPEVKSHNQVFEFLRHAVERAGYKLGEDIVFGIDVGASELYDEEKKVYRLPLEGHEFTAEELMDYYLDLAVMYPVRFFEDPFDQEDWEAWRDFTNDHFVKDRKLYLIGDDLFATNIARLKKGLELKAANTILIKPNQIGTLTETLETICFAQEHNYKVIVSHRSGETSDTSIADLAVAVKAEYIKTGSTARGERIDKYNRLLNIEEELK